MASEINFAKAFGFNSVAAAAVFAVLYSLFAGYFVFKIIKNRGRVLISLTLFCFSTLLLFKSPTITDLLSSFYSFLHSPSRSIRYACYFSW